MESAGCLAVIPARGGSRRLPRKNIRPLRGKPLIAYTIAAARQSGLFDRIVVSTDDPEVAQIAQDQGADVPFLRPQTLADDHTPVSAATADALARLDPDARLFRFVCQLLPTCPLRPAAAIVASHRQFARLTAPAQISVVRYGWQNPWWALRLGQDQTLEPLFAEQLTRRSQDLPALFCPSGAVWWGRAEVLRSTATFHGEGRTGWEIPWQQGLDIDTEDDWALAEALLHLQQPAEDLD